MRLHRSLGMSLNRLVTRAATLDGRGVSSYRKQRVSKRRVRERWKPQVSLEERTSAITESLTDSPILSLLTYVQPPSDPWSCLNCRTKDMWQSCGKKQPLHQESEVLQMQMKPEEQLVSGARSLRPLLAGHRAGAQSDSRLNLCLKVNHRPSLGFHPTTSHQSVVFKGDPHSMCAPKSPQAWKLCSAWACR